MKPVQLFSVVLASCALCALSAPLYATAISVHISQEDYYAAGTSVKISQDNFGATDFTVGNISGTSQWEVTEKVWWDDVANETIISYTVFNDAYALNITSIHVPVGAGLVASSIAAPSGWTAAQVGSEIIWQTSGAGIPRFQSLDTMIVTYPGLRPIVFLPNAQVDFGNGSLISNVDWVISSVPEPLSACLLLLGSLVLVRRRR